MAEKVKEMLCSFRSSSEGKEMSYEEGDQKTLLEIEDINRAKQEISGYTSFLNLKA